MASERKFVAENIRRVLLKEYFLKETEMAGFGGIDIQRTPMGTRVTLTVERPGMVIGRKGSKIKELTRRVSEDYGFDNPQIEVQECRNSSTNPQIMAQKLALALERGWHFRRAGHSTLRRIMDTDVKGAQVKLSGKLTGQRHRTEKFKWGHIKFCGEPAITTMERGYAIAKKKLGLIGVSVDIMKEDAHLPDEVRILEAPDISDLLEIEVPEENKAEEVVEKEEETSEEQKEEAAAEDVPKENEGAEETTTTEETKKTSKRKRKREKRRKASEEGSQEEKDDKSQSAKDKKDTTKGEVKKTVTKKTETSKEPKVKSPEVTSEEKVESKPKPKKDEPPIGEKKEKGSEKKEKPSSPKGSKKEAADNDKSDTKEASPNDEPEKKEDE